MTRVITSVFLLAPIAGFAHAGHGQADGNSLLHYFASMEHVLPLGAILLLVGWMLFRRNQKAATKNS